MSASAVDKCNELLEERAAVVRFLRELARRASADPIGAIDGYSLVSSAAEAIARGKHRR